MANKKKTPVYTLEPGRNIYRDGKPFVYISKCPYPVEPSDADDFARLVVKLLRERGLSHDLRD